MNNTVQHYIDEFELYLEGVKIPTFESIQISEVEGQPPAAQISFIFNTEVLKLLQGTLVQVFCRRTYNDKSKKTESLLLFEGEVSYISFNYSSFGHMVTFKASSILAKMFKARMRPSHAVLQQEQFDAELLVSQKFSIDDNNSHDGKKLVSEEKDNTDDVVKKNNSETQDNTVLENKNKTYKGISGNFKDLKNEASIQNFLQAISEELAPTNNKPGSKGDYNYILQRFNREFEKNDLFYGLNSIGFKIGPSLVAFPNPGKAKAYHLAVFQKALNSYLQDLSSNPLTHKEDYNLIQILEILKTNLHYKFLIPAAPFSATHLNSINITNSRIPIRLLLIPDFESAPPINCNVFFPEQIDNFSFQRDYINEASRLIASMSYANMPGMEGLPEYLNPIHVVPDMDIKQEKDKNGKVVISSKLLFEETYKGVTLRSSQYDAALVKTLYDQSTGKEKTTKLDETTVKKINNSEKQSNTVLNKNSEKEAEINDMLRIHALQDFSNLKFGQRMATFTAEWSPYRIVGLSSAALLKSNVHAVGIIQSLNTIISAKGQLQSTVTLRNVRLIFDNISKTVDVNIVDNKKTTLNSTFINNHMVIDNYREGLLGPNPIAFNEDLYSFENIGKTLYSYITTGFINDYTKTSAADSLVNYTVQPIKDVNHSIVTEVVNTSPEIQYRNYENLKVNLNRVVQVNSPELDGKTAEKSSSQKLIFQEDFNKRVLVTKVDYLEYLGIKNLDDLELKPENYSKHLYNILKAETNDPVYLQKLNTDNGQLLLSEFPKFTVDYTDSGYSDPKNIYRIYNTNRLAHVLNLKNYLKTINNIT